jgi:hypothetical protein
LDDYVELEMAQPDGNTMPLLATLASQPLPDGTELDVQLRGKPPTSAGILALYVGGENTNRNRPESEHLAVILAAVVSPVTGDRFWPVVA